MFCHLRSRVFANERPTVPSIFNVYGDSGESLMAMIIRTRISTRFRGWFFACTPRCLPRSKKSIAGFTGAVYARVCPSFGCVLPFVYPIYYIRVTMLRFACECARASLYVYDSPDPLSTLFYTHRNTCVARTTNSGVPSKLATTVVCLPDSIYVVSVFLRFEIISLWKHA